MDDIAVVSLPLVLYSFSVSQRGGLFQHGVAAVILPEWLLMSCIFFGGGWGWKA